MWKVKGLILVRGLRIIIIVSLSLACVKLISTVFMFVCYQLSVISLLLNSTFRPITDPAYEDINNAFERSLVFMHKVHCTRI